MSHVGPCYDPSLYFYCPPYVPPYYPSLPGGFGVPILPGQHLDPFFEGPAGGCTGGLLWSVLNGGGPAPGLAPAAAAATPLWQSPPTRGSRRAPARHPVPAAGPEAAAPLAGPEEFVLLQAGLPFKAPVLASWLYGRTRSPVGRLITKGRPVIWCPWDRDDQCFLPKCQYAHVLPERRHDVIGIMKMMSDQPWPDMDATVRMPTASPELAHELASCYGHVLRLNPAARLVYVEFARPQEAERCVAECKCTDERGAVLQAQYTPRAIDVHAGVRYHPVPEAAPPSPARESPPVSSLPPPGSPECHLDPALADLPPLGEQSSPALLPSPASSPPLRWAAAAGADEADGLPRTFAGFEQEYGPGAAARCDGSRAAAPAPVEGPPTPASLSPLASGAATPAPASPVRQRTPRPAPPALPQAGAIWKRELVRHLLDEGVPQARADELIQVFNVIGVERRDGIAELFSKDPDCGRKYITKADEQAVNLELAKLNYSMLRRTEKATLHRFC
eukprot:TRINITY_DN8043_c0_g3_i3.p1 TRINITY_DN8043_c0_g3~~TRINITY_DN8043_c0_g3_i3.p1  ORF type:complete len:526 (+),score=67.95 TRINITY_DN8043_c0_g3_i3:67-1578(+)